ncbi:MAG: dihydrolipoamide succinyltransferase [endosymbiont of Galathealinum brachiosum]|uniref:Dihydrolipoyllysine-residue succinyltransferase component of 2-oxoglutarate dehydrogenase complex n=1 Tax=endosymbiont of Galathealinum brachiosum TaxID=2200906 RepID=A0A370DBW1_9GAMM|nr:MAG: dihydrolipoamide succinyltransferase [endosymbiont of Galathealinum brachiosum]
MSIEVKVPGLPESVSDATIVTWRKQPGETINRDESLVDLETDKVVLEVPSPIDGVVAEHHQAEGDVVMAGQLLATLNEVGVESSKENKPDETPERIITPSAKKMIAENKLNSDVITGSGKDGRVLKEDVQTFMQQVSLVDTLARRDAPTQFEVVEQKSIEAISEDSVQGDRIEKRVPMTRLRSRIAERLLDAQHNAAILTTFNEVNMQPVMDLRNKYKDLFAKKYDVKLGFMSFFVKATIEALKRFPAVNASIDGNDIVYHGYFDIGVAVASPRGLVVPVLRNADQMSLAEIESGIAELVDKARNNQLSIDDMTGGTFSLTNGGVFGSMLSTPIINPPQSGILGMHKIQQRAMVEDGEIVARPVMYLALSYDHRIIDGAEAVQFLVTIKDVLEDPARILVGV